MALTTKLEDTFLEINLYDGETMVGTMEINPTTKMLERLNILEPYRGKGYGQQAVKLAIEQYGVDVLWVRADNDVARHIYEKLGFKITKPTFYEMRRE